MKNKGILQSAAVVAVASILVRLTSFLRDMSLAAAVMGAVVYVGYPMIPFEGAATLVSAVYLAGLVLGGIGIYVVAHIAMRSVFIADCVAVLRGLLASRRER